MLSEKSAVCDGEVPNTVSMNRKLRLLHVIGSLGVGGCEKQLLGLCQRMDKQIFTLGLLWYAATPDCMVEEFNRAGIKTFFVDKYALSKIRFFFTLRRIITSFQPDIVHAWLPSAGFWGRCAALSCGIKNIIMSYRVELQAGIPETSRAARLLESFLFRKSLILANSRAIAQSIERYLGVPEDRVRIIYNAVELATADRGKARSEIRKELGLPPEQKIVLMVARQHKQKNYPLFVKIAALVRQWRDDVTFVGVGREDMRDELAALTTACGVSDIVRFVGIRHDIHRWLAAADLFCFTSNYEGFPNAVLEAMLAGLPVVTTAFSGVEEVVTNGETGCIVPCNDAAALATAVQRLLSDEIFAQRLGQSAQTVAQSRYSWQNLVQTMQELYLHIAQR